MKIDWKKLILALLLPQLAGFIGSLFTTPKISSWYATIIKPSFNPPNWIFGPVWVFLFILMGIALYLIWIKKDNKLALTFFSIQLGLNILWSILFFGLQSPLLALIEIFILEIFILLTIKEFYKISKKAAYILIPYISWVSFAIILNFAIVILN
ncbi:MAG: tryptophan-rich sensory protein [Nanoarchaeota archaeon]|nr:tryptophan-rich sensory protein [Nanoarchaeota archaeon]MBU4242618.1 tryptophan-rich sensory protein [Nanoarchaeota archaeon]MBU4351656.1 tryptophan-rich sensory protein [Nanoarchaeota archaeon]MBU4456800.1 tryptophan-rich sensory protein [Nanoarchaeota archaeon]MCG2719809.1 tryptophan-rich sensory protein [Nanoarchaeota archaeon]